MQCWFWAKVGLHLSKDQNVVKGGLLYMRSPHAKVISDHFLFIFLLGGKLVLVWGQILGENGVSFGQMPRKF